MSANQLTIDVKNIMSPPDNFDLVYLPEYYQFQKRDADKIAYPSPSDKRIRLEDGMELAPITNYMPPSPPGPYQFTQNPLPKATALRPIIKAKKPKASKTKTEIARPTHVISDDGKQIWELIKSIGKGGCGEVFLSKSINKSDSQFVAVKVIKVKYSLNKERKQFNSEYNTMKILNTHTNGRGYTPKLLFACKKQKALIMEHLSETIAIKFENSNFKLSLKTILMLALNIVLVI